MDCQEDLIPISLSGDFLAWWFDSNQLHGSSFEVFRKYYSNYYNRFSGYLKDAWSDRHLELEQILSTCPKNRAMKCLDIGCGTGTVSLYMAYRLMGRGRVKGVDIKDDRLACARERKHLMAEKLGRKIDCNFVKSDVLSLPSDEKYDLIFLEETLHHLEPRRRQIAKIKDLVADNGFIVISEVNAYNFAMQVSLLKKRGLKTIEKRVDKDGSVYVYGIERIVPARVIRKLFDDGRVKMVSLRYFRIFGSMLAKFFDFRGIDLMRIEKGLLKCSSLSRIISVHYNIVFKKNGTDTWM